MSEFYGFTLPDSSGRTVDLSLYRGKVVLVVNTATHCGLTGQYRALQDLYARYGGEGLEILDFPCNQFRGQAPEAAGEIAEFCEGKFGTRFRIFDKIEVNGDGAHPLYRWLKAQKPYDEGERGIKPWLLRLAAAGLGLRTGDIRWNFTKFLLDREGRVVARFAPAVEPHEMEEAIRRLLAV